MFLQKLCADGIIESPIKIYPRCAIMNNRASTSPGSALVKYLQNQSVFYQTEWE